MMRKQARLDQSWNGRTMDIVPLSPADRERKIKLIVARRAFQISEEQGFVPGHELENWRSAESEILSPLCAGFTERGADLLVSTSCSHFEKGAIVIGVEPRRLTLFGTRRKSTEHQDLEADGSNLPGREIVHSLELPIEIDPSRVIARFSHGMLEISLPKSRTSVATSVESRVA